MSNQKYSFSIIHHRGSPNEATTLDGHKVERQEELFIPDWGTFVKCAQYDDHFVYEDPESKNIVGRWMHMCTCGAPGIIVGYKAYEQDASKYSGGLLVCKAFTDSSIETGYGVHQTGGRKWQ
jgi:hypothetical protein